ncbi:hypothetical protein CsSME_00022753 [Camellia sinensis var. sinensis]
MEEWGRVGPSVSSFTSSNGSNNTPIKGQLSEPLEAQTKNPFLIFAFEENPKQNMQNSAKTMKQRTQMDVLAALRCSLCLHLLLCFTSLPLSTGRFKQMG